MPHKAMGASSPMCDLLAVRCSNIFCALHSTLHGERGGGGDCKGWGITKGGGGSHCGHLGHREKRVQNGLFFAQRAGAAHGASPKGQRDASLLGCSQPVHRKSTPHVTRCILRSVASAHFLNYKKMCAGVRGQHAACWCDRHGGTGGILGLTDTLLGG